MSQTSLHAFQPERVINEGTSRVYPVLTPDPRAKSINFLGSCVQADGRRVTALLLAEKTAISKAFVERAFASGEDAFERLETIGKNDIYNWVFGWPRSGDEQEAPMKMTLICPANGDLVAKYSAQERVMIRETADLYERVTRPFIEALPATKTEWVHNILDGKSEANSVLHRDDDPKTGFVVCLNAGFTLTSASTGPQMGQENARFAVFGGDRT